MNNYRNAAGMSCCGARDCVQAPVRLLTQQAETTTVEVNGVVLDLPAKSVHVSEDANSYVCYAFEMEPPKPDNVRCVFYAVGG